MEQYLRYLRDRQKQQLAGDCMDKPQEQRILYLKDWHYTKYVSVVQYHTQIHTHTHTHTHTHKSKKQSLQLPLSGHTDPVKCWGTWALIRLYEPGLANPPGGGLVPCRWSCSMPRVMVWAPEVPHPLADMDSSLTCASPVHTRSPFNSWVDWKQILVQGNSNNTKVATLGIEPTTF